MTRETASLIAAALQPLLVAVVAAIAAWAAAQIRKRTNNTLVRNAVDNLARGAEGVVADLAQHVVDDLKDPSKPGTWDAVAKASVRNTAATRVRALLPADVAALEGHVGADAAADLIGTLIERAVRNGKIAAPPSVPSPLPSSPQSGRARIGALVVLALVGALGLSALRCTPPPPSDGGVPVVTPSGWTQTARVAVTVGRGLIVVARPIVEAATQDPGRTTARRAFDATDAALVGLGHALDAYDARGGDRCAAYAAAGASAIALQELAEVLAANGIALGVPLERVVDLVAGVVDTLVPSCDTDAGFASAGRAANDRLLSLERGARARGVILRRDLDTITPALDGGVR